jgi:hypothetical protein
VDAGQLHRILTTVWASAQPVAMFLFVLYFTRSRKWAAVAGLAYTFFSPAYGLYRTVDWDRGLGYLPRRMQVLAKYGEGPHTAGLAMMPLALAACWRAATGRKYAHILLAAVLLAAVCLTNWVAALSTAACCLLLLVTGFTYSGETGFRMGRMLAAAGLGYLLAAFWLTPRFVKTTLFNWPRDATNYHVHTMGFVLFGGLIVSTVVVWLVLVRLPGTVYFRFVAACAWVFFYIVSWYYWTGYDPIPEARRYVPEMEFFLIAAWLELMRVLLKDGRRRARDAAMLLAGIALVPGAIELVQYVIVPWDKLQPIPREQTIEYRVSRFLADQKPQGRVFVTGGTRFRLNSWFLIPQVGGTFESGLLNRTPLFWIYHTRTGLGDRPELRGSDSVLMLRLAGAEYIAAHKANSKEHWKDLKDPDQFRGLLPVVWDEGEDVIYRVPFSGLAHLVRAEEMPLVQPVRWETRRAAPYVKAFDAPGRPHLECDWQGPNRMEIRGPVPEGLLVSAMITFDGNWDATQDGQPLPVGRDMMGYTLLKPRPSAATRIVLDYHAAPQHIAMTALSALVWLAALAAWWWERRRSGPLAENL